MALRCGVQLSTFLTAMETPAQLEEICTALSSMGCQVVQSQWMTPTLSSRALAGCFGRHGLECVSAQDLFDAICVNFEETIALLRACGAKNLCVSGIPQRFASPAGLAAFTALLEAFTAQAENQGLQVMFHPRAQELYGQTDHLLGEIPRLQLCVDVYHYVHAGVSAVETMQRFAGRVPMLHCKDYAPDGTLCPTGQGVIAWPPVLEAARENGVAWALAEQETWHCPPLSCMQDSLRYLLGQGCVF